jgi:hypothetical protein
VTLAEVVPEVKSLMADWKAEITGSAKQSETEAEPVVPVVKAAADAGGTTTLDEEAEFDDPEEAEFIRRATQGQA